MPNRGEGIRAYQETAVTFASGAAVSNVFTLANFGLGLVYLASGVTGFGLALQVAPHGGAFSTLVDRSNGYGTDVSCVLPTAQLVAQAVVPMPAFWFGAGGDAKLLIHDGAGSGIPQTLARACTITMKS
jgi:hypothetical protein